jgi:hypothetical protein
VNTREKILYLRDCAIELRAISAKLDAMQGGLAKNCGDDSLLAKDIEKFDDAVDEIDDLMVAVEESKERYEDEIAEDEHDCRMTDDPIYRDAWVKSQKEKEIAEHGINED